MKPRRRFLCRAYGFLGGLFEIITVSLLAVAFLTTTLTLSVRENTEQRNRATAVQLKLMAQAAQTFGRGNSDIQNLFSTEPNLQIVFLDVTPRLVAGAEFCNRGIYLGGSPPQNFFSTLNTVLFLACPDQSDGWMTGLPRRNPYGQGYRLFFERRGTTNDFDAWVVTQGGNPIPTPSLVQIAKYAGPQGGFRSSTPPYNTPTNIIWGSSGTWLFDTAAIDQRGALFTLQFLEGFGSGFLAYRPRLRNSPHDTETTPRLVRDSTANNGNVMEADLFLRDHNINFTNCSATNTCEIQVENLVLCDRPGTEALGFYESDCAFFSIVTDLSDTDLGRLRVCWRQSDGSYARCRIVSP